MIRRIAIDNYRCFTNFELEPRRVNLLLGPNGTGKSTLFDAVTELVDLVRQGIEVNEAFPTSSLTRWDKRDRQRFELEVEGNNGRYHYVLVVRHDQERGNAEIESERVVFEDKTLFAFSNGAVHLHQNDGSKGATFAFRGSRSFLAQIEERPETKDLMWFLDLLENIWTIRLDVGEISSISKEEEDVLARDGSNFASWYRDLAQENPEKLMPLWEVLRESIPGFTSLKLLSAGGQGRVRDLIATMNTGGMSYELIFDELSDGQRALIVLYALLKGHEPDKGCLLLDEPEAHVGLPEVQPWLVALDERLQDRGQVFIISHHPEVVDYLAASAPFLFERPDAGPARVRLANFDRSSGLLASKQIAQGFFDGE
ncbi:MAG: AAA family ATPase [Proteobacteria bacterium]|nr:AAA family ATPase [Pseudomonadota bacterium]